MIPLPTRSRRAHPRRARPPARARRLLPAALAALTALLLLAACDVPGDVRLHQVDLYGDPPGGPARLRWFYGEPGTVEVAGRRVRLQEPARRADLSEVRYGVPEALLADSRPVLRTALGRLDVEVLQANRVPATTDLEVRVRTDVGEVLYFDGRSWLTLLPGARAGAADRVAPRPRLGRLRGLGDLTTAEADALADRLEAEGPLVIAEILREDPARAVAPVDGTSEHLVTELWVQRGLPVDAAAFRAPPAEAIVERVAGGSQAAVEEPSYRLATDDASLLRLWNLAHGSSLSPAPLPDADFRREAVAFAFMGRQPTGGYGFELRGATREGSDVFVDLARIEPAPDAITTQALTSPWIAVRVLRQDVAAVWFRDPETGELYGVARREP